jgi:hypothetical protein
VGEGRIKEKGIRGQIWPKYYVLVYENEKCDMLKLFWWGGRRIKENDGAGEFG